MTWSGDATYGLPEPEGKPPMDEVSKAVLAGVCVLLAVCFVIVIAMMTGGGDKAEPVAVQAPAAPVVPEPAPTVTVTATPEPAPTVYVTQPPAPLPPPPVQEVPQTVPLAPAGPSEDDARRLRANCYDALGSSTQLHPQARWTNPCQEGFPNVDPGQFMFREQHFAQRLRAMAPRDWGQTPGPELAGIGWAACSASQRSRLDRSELAREIGRGSTRSSGGTTTDFLIIVNAALDALCPEAEYKPGADGGYGGGYGSSGSGPRYGA